MAVCVLYKFVGADNEPTVDRAKLCGIELCYIYLDVIYVCVGCEEGLEIPEREKLSSCLLAESKAEANVVRGRG